MNEIDRVFTKYPFFGSRQIAAYLPRNGFHAGRHRIRRLIGVMGLQAIHCPAVHVHMHERVQGSQHQQEAPPQHPIYPSLLRTLPITRPNHVWCSDITYQHRLGRLLCNRLPGNGCGVDSCISWRLWIGRRARGCHGSSPTRWMPAFTLSADCFAIA